MINLDLDIGGELTDHSWRRVVTCKLYYHLEWSFTNLKKK